jgi:DNA-directed RNA polymerase subunit K/omega
VVVKVSLSTLLLQVKEKYPNSYLLVGILSQRVKQLGAHAMNGQSTRSLVRRAMEEGAAGELRVETRRTKEVNREDASDLIKWPD